jgi:hypothetical protein
MFVRFRQTESRLQVSLIETRRLAGKVQHEHIAGLGSISTAPSTADRIAFWERLHAKLTKLSNRIDAETHGKVLGAIHARIPMVTADEQQALQIENAEADELLWSRLHDMHAGTVEDHKGLAATVANAIATRTSAMTEAANNAAAAKQRVERLRKGESLPGGLGQPLNLWERLRAGGWTEAELQHCVDLASLGEGGAKEVSAEMSRRQLSFEKIALRAVRKRRRSDDD